MPHDRNGKLVEVGDIVMGKVYKHDIISPVLSVTPGCTSCDMQVAVIEVLPGECEAFGRIVKTQDRIITFVVLPSVETVTAADFEQKADGTEAV